MSYKITLQDDADRLDLEMLQIPIADSYIEGASDNTTLDGNVYTDYLYLKHQWSQKWSRMDAETFARLKGFYERQFTTRKYPYYTLSDLQNTTDVRTESTQLYYGAPIEYTNGIAMNSLEIKGATEQNSYTGKNLLDINKFAQPGAYSGLTVQMVNKDSNTGTIGIKVTGNVSENLWSIFSLTSNIQLKPNTRYTLSRTFAVSGTTYKDAGGIRIKIGSSYTVVTTNNSSSFTTDSTGIVQILIYASYNQSGTLSNVNTTVTFSNLQLEENSTKTDFEPYVGGTASPNPTYPQEVKTVTGLTNFTVSAAGFEPQTVEINLGKNLIDLSVFTSVVSGSGVTFTIANGKIILNGTVTAREDIYVYSAEKRLIIPSGTTVTLSRSNNRTNLIWHSFTAETGGASRDVAYLSKNGALTHTYTTTASDYGFRFIIRADVGTVFNNEEFCIQLERGTKATSYAAYFEPIELCKIGDYQDRIYKSGWRWFLEKNTAKVIVTSNTDVYKQAYGGNTYSITAPNMNQSTTNKNVYSEYFTPLSWEARTLNTQNSVYSRPNDGYSIEIRNTQWATVDSFKSWAVNNLSFYYALAAPETTEITDWSLIGELDNALYSYLFDTNGTISATASNGLQAPLLADIAYWYYEHEPTPILHNKAVRMTLNSDGVVDCCGTQQNVQITLRETRND